MISFHVASLLANESVDQAIDIILPRIYIETPRFLNAKIKEQNTLM